jgi:hypothetical protein
MFFAKAYQLFKMTQAHARFENFNEFFFNSDKSLSILSLLEI